MRVGIDIDWLRRSNRDGLFNHSAGLLEGVRQAGLADLVELYTWVKPATAINPAVNHLLTGFTIRQYHPPYRLRRLRNWLRRYTRYGRLDVFQTMTQAGFVAIPGRLNAYVVPDLTTVRVPECHTPDSVALWAQYFETVRNHADLVITWSNHTRDDVIRALGISGEKVVAIPLGCNSHFRPVLAEEAAPQLQALGLRPQNYILTVGTIEPRKNHTLLFRAYASLKARGRVDGIPLVVVGGKGWGYEPILAEISRLGLSNDVRLVGFAASLPVMYSGAAVMAYPSRYEGFGLPPLEAMACGCPVIASSATSLPEVVGDAGLLVDPDDTEGFADALDRVLSDAELRGRMSGTGIARGSEFTWRRYAEGVFSEYRARLGRV